MLLPSTPDVRGFAANRGFFKILRDYVRHVPYFTLEMEAQAAGLSRAIAFSSSIHLC